MQWVCGLAVLAFLVFMVVGALTGRVQARQCCAVADPHRDLRMSAAFDDVEVSPGRHPR